MKIVMARFATPVNIAGKTETIVTMQPGRPGYHADLKMKWADGFLFLSHPSFGETVRAVPMANVPYMDVVLEDEPKKPAKK